MLQYSTHSFLQACLVYKLNVVVGRLDDIEIHLTLFHGLNNVLDNGDKIKASRAIKYLDEFKTYTLLPASHIGQNIAPAQQSYFGNHSVQSCPCTL